MDMTATLVLAAATAVVGTAAGSVSSAAVTEPVVERLWKGDAPGSEGVEDIERVEDLRPAGDPRGPSRRIYDVSVPTLTWYPAPPEKATGTAVIVCPGGAFRRLAVDHEGHDAAKWLNTLGVTAAVLKYHVGKQGNNADPAPLAVADGKRAVRLVRSKAGELKIHPNRIGMMGFSAGAFLIAGLMSDMDDGDPKAADPIDHLSCRPDFAALIYGGTGGLNEKNITKDLPPVFMVQAANDSIANEQYARLWTNLYRAKVSAELHIFATGGHGFGLGVRGGSVTAWPGLFANWLKERQKLEDTFTHDYFERQGGEAKAVLTPDTKLTYKNAAGESATATAAPMTADAKGVVFSGWESGKGRKIAYAFCRLRSDKARKVQCYFGSDDEGRVWVNGELAWRTDNPRTCKPREDSFTVELKEGLNPVMVKVSQRTMTWAFILEAVGPEGEAPSAGGKAGLPPVNDLRPDGRIEDWLVMVLDIAEAE